MDKIITKFGIGLALMIALSAHAQWGSSPGMMPWGGQSFMQPQAQQPFSGGMPWGSGEQRYNQCHGDKVERLLIKHHRHSLLAA